MGCSPRSVAEFGNGNLVDQVSLHNSGFFLWSPSRDELAFSTKIPDGTRVLIKDVKGIDAEWQDGEVVKPVDGKAIRNLSDLDMVD